MRQSPGGHNTSAHSGNNGKNTFWKNTEYQDRLALLWRKIAERYKDKEIIAGYDLLNEPAADTMTELNQAYSRIIKKIREVDTNHIIILEGNKFSTEFTGLDKFAEVFIGGGDNPGLDGYFL